MEKFEKKNAKSFTKNTSESQKRIETLKKYYNKILASEWMPEEISPKNEVLFSELWADFSIENDEIFTHIAHQELRDILQKAINEKIFTKEDRKLLDMEFFQSNPITWKEYSHAEIGKHFWFSAATSKSHSNEAMKKLRKFRHSYHLEDFADEQSIEKIYQKLGSIHMRRNLDLIEQKWKNKQFSFYEQVIIERIYMAINRSRKSYSSDQNPSYLNFLLKQLNQLVGKINSSKQ